MRADPSAGSGLPRVAPRGERWLDWAAFATWLVVGVPTISRIAAGDLPSGWAVGWMAMFVAFGAALADCLRPGSISRPRRIVMMTLQALTGVGMMYVGVNGTAGAVLVIVAAEAAITFAARGAWLWVVAQTLGIAFVLRQFDNWSDTIALTGAYADRAHALVRCVQEIVTNATRHGQAANLWIRIAAQPGGIALDARDDGRGAREVTWGHGLTGMRERFAELSGSIDVTAGSGRGFEIRGFMPCRGTVS